MVHLHAVEFVERHIVQPAPRRFRVDPHRRALPVAVELVEKAGGRRTSASGGGGAVLVGHRIASVVSLTAISAGVHVMFGGC